MKQIRIKFIGFWSDFVEHDNLFTRLLSNKFKISICDNPDYIICSPLCKPFEYMKFDCIRILFSGENYSPDFNVFDYAIGFDNIVYNDRFCRFPLYLYDEITQSLDNRHIDEITSQEILKQKKYFCNFIYSHPSSHGLRESILEELQKYKHIECAGTFMNNMPDGYYAKNYSEKIDFIHQCKFTIAIESTTLSGFTTEKMVHPYLGNSIPIYYGNPDISTDFNSNSFINCHEYDTISEIVNRIIELDQQDEKYLEMLRQPIFTKPNYVKTKLSELTSFLHNIFSQDIKNAYRRPLYYSGEQHNRHLKIYQQIRNHPIIKIYNHLPKILK